MNCDKVIATLPDFLAGNISEDKSDTLHAHAATCAPCGAELESLSAVWSAMDRWPTEEPSEELRTRVYRMFDAFESGKDERPAPRVSWWRHLIGQPLTWQMVAAAALVAGFWLSGRNDTNKTQIMNDQSTQQLADTGLNDTQPMAQRVKLALLGDEKPAQRLRAIQATYSLDLLDANVLEALLLTLNQDPNLNVRLSALEVLYDYLDQPKVREGLVRALPNQDSPLVQVALVDCLVATGESRAASTLQDLLLEPNLDPAVRAKAQAGISVLQ